LFDLILFNGMAMLKAAYGNNRYTGRKKFF
jgi:hypothetical protein